MATTFNVKLGIKSYAGFRYSNNNIRSVPPTIQTLTDLAGDTYASTGNSLIAPAITDITVLDEFESIIGITSEPQTYSVKNNGTGVLTIIGLTFSITGALELTFDPSYPVVEENPTTFNFITPIEIAPGSTFNYIIKYKGWLAGEYTNVINFLTPNFGNGFIRVLSRQLIKQENDFTVNESPGIVSTITTLGGNAIHSYTITPVINGVVYDYLAFAPSAVITSLYPGWSVIGRTEESVNIKFDSLSVWNSAETSFTASVAISAFNQTYNVISRVDLDVDSNLNKHYGSWLSEGSDSNSIIGISYDIIGGIKYITIGVGMGGDGIPEYSKGGSIFATTSTLSVVGKELDYPFTAWALVYRFPIQPNHVYDSGQINPSRSLEYIYKETPKRYYYNQFGVEGQQGSMFVVECFNDGSINIRMNMLDHLRTLTDRDNTDYNTTLLNLSNAFYSSTPEVDDRFVQQFYGFTASGKVIIRKVVKPSLPPLEYE